MPGAFISIAEESRPDRGTRPADPARCVHPGPAVERVGSCRPWAACRVNVSAATCSKELVADVRDALEISGLDPGSLVIELTESTIMQNTEVTSSDSAS